MKVFDLVSCSLPSWYNTFKSISIESVFYKLDECFIKYLKEDRIILPRGWDQNEEANIEFKDIFNFINKALEKFNNSVFPKLNWSAPKDAYYMILEGTTLKCTSPADVIHLLKASEFISYDLQSPFDLCIDNSVDHLQYPRYLVLKKHINVSPAWEFRCFVRENQLIGVTQRYSNNYSKELATNFRFYTDSIVKLFDKKIKNKFSLSNYVFDLVLINDVLKLVDFNVWSNELTGSGLFSWAELEEIRLEDNCLPRIKFVAEQGAVRELETRQYGRPIDIETHFIGQNCSLIDFIKKTIENESSSDESDDENLQ